jgi:poly(3-hydroxybutyrate) depolymerase
MIEARLKHRSETDSDYADASARAARQRRSLFTIRNASGAYSSAMFQGLFIGVFATQIATSAFAAQTVSLPAWVCAHPDAIFISEFDTAESPVPHDPTNGTGGAKGTTTHTFHIAGLGTGTQTYYVYVPADYSPSQAYPFVLALHGTAPYSLRNTYASNVLSAWSSVAASARVIVAAPVADDAVDVNGQPGASWSVPPASPSDYDVFAAVLAQVEGSYNIDRTRIYGWGFSAGGSVMHALGLTADSGAFNNASMAAYASQSGPLAGDLCDGLSAGQCNAILDAASRKVPVAMVVATGEDAYSYVLDDDNRFRSQGWTANTNVFLNTFSSSVHDYSVATIQPAWGHLCPLAVTP